MTTDDMKAELEANGYQVSVDYSMDDIEPEYRDEDAPSLEIWITAPDGWLLNYGSHYSIVRRTVAELDAVIVDYVTTAYAHLQQQRELARYRELGKQAHDVPLGAYIDQERIIDRMDEVYVTMTSVHITADESDAT